MQELARTLRGVFGNDVLAETLLKDIEEAKESLIVMEGFRYFDEYRILKQYPHFTFVGIEVTFDNRLQRIQQRTENIGDGQVTTESFVKQHEHETERAIPELIVKADYRIDNNGAPEKLYAQLDALMVKLKI